jgi:hypothetical protein
MTDVYLWEVTAPSSGPLGLLNQWRKAVTFSSVPQYTGSLGPSPVTTNDSGVACVDYDHTLRLSKVLSRSDRRRSTSPAHQRLPAKTVSGRSRPRQNHFH